MASFSERMGFVEAPEFLQLNDISEPLSNLMFNFCERLLRSDHQYSLVAIEDRINDLLKERRRTFQLWRRGVRGDGAYFDVKLFAGSYDALEFHGKYSVMEVVMTAKGANTSVEEINQILEQENSAYRMNEYCELIPISNAEEIAEVSSAQQNSVSTVASHMNQAVALFADREKPDYANSIKEAVNALEALVRKITGEPKGTLGQLIKNMELHPSLREAVSKLYGYASDGGIRHAKKEDDLVPDFDTAKFVIVTSSALINFITAKSE